MPVPDILLHGERLLIRSVRVLALGGVCPGWKAAFEEACGAGGHEAWRSLEAFVQQLACKGRRRLAVCVPADTRLTVDEALILDVFACAQAEAHGAMIQRLTRLIDRHPPFPLGAAACVVAQAMEMGGLLLEVRGDQCWAASTTPSSTAAQWAAAAATT